MSINITQIDSLCMGAAYGRFASVRVLSANCRYVSNGHIYSTYIQVRGQHADTGGDQPLPQDWSVSPTDRWDIFHNSIELTSMSRKAAHREVQQQRSHISRFADIVRTMDNCAFVLPIVSASNHNN